MTEEPPYQPHLLRTIFISEHLSMGLDLNTTAYALNDRPGTVLQAYNQLMEGRHRPLLQEANRQALARGHGQRLTPSVVPPTLPRDRRGPPASATATRPADIAAGHRPCKAP